MAKGGARPGAGRPKGSYNKPQLRDYVSEEEVLLLVEKAKEQASEKPELLKFLLDHVFGKARQNIGLGGEEEGSPIMFIPSEIAKKHDINTASEDNSGG